MILKTIAILAVGLCMTGNAWSDNEIGKACFTKHRDNERACNADSKCTFNRDSDRCLARCSPLASSAATCNNEPKSCSFFRGQCATVL